MLITVAIALTLCASMVALLRPFQLDAHEIGPQADPVKLIGFDGVGVLMAFVLFIFFSSALGPAFALSMLSAFALHEAGHVLANRMLKRGESRFRMVPFLTRVKVEAKPFQTEAEAFFVALMGAGFSLAPMSLAFAISITFANVAPELSGAMLVLGATIGALNCFFMMPFPPLEGGICAQLTSRNFWPALGPGMTTFMVAAFGVAGIRHGSIALLLMSAFGIYSLFVKSDNGLEPMGHNTALLALGAYAFTLAAHFTGGWMLFQLMF